MEIKVIPMSYENIDDVIKVEQSAFLHPWSKQSFLDELVNPLARYFVLIIDNKVSGYAGLWHIVDEGHITNIAIKKELQGQGLSNYLLKEIIDYKNKNNLIFLTLEVRESNIIAQKLYEKYNFKKIGERKKYYENSETAFLYSLEG